MLSFPSPGPGLTRSAPQCPSHGPGGGGDGGGNGGDGDTNFDDSSMRSDHEGMIAGTEQSEAAQEELSALVTQLELSGVDVLSCGADTLLSQEVAAIDRCLNGCFVAGTPVQMADGSVKPIEQVREGDLVLSRDQNDRAGVDGKVVAARVVRTFVHQHPSEQMVTVTLSSGEQGEKAERIVCTDNHPFFVPGKGWTPAGMLCIGTAIAPRAGPRTAGVEGAAVPEREPCMSLVSSGTRRSLLVRERASQEE